MSHLATPILTSWPPSKLPSPGSSVQAGTALSARSVEQDHLGTKAVTSRECASKKLLAHRSGGTYWQDITRVVTERQRYQALAGYTPAALSQ